MKSHKAIICKSGFRMSVQASATSYSRPENNSGPYTHVEIGFPSETEDMIMRFAEDPNYPCGTVYPYVPVGVVKAVIIKHGGSVEGDHPYFDINAEQSFILAKALLDDTNS